MAPTCDLMIKIIKVNRLYLNSLLVSIVNRVSRSGRMKYQYENTDESNKKWLLIKEGTFFIAGRGVGRGILEIFCKKSRGPPTSQRHGYFSKPEQFGRLCCEKGEPYIANVVSRAKWPTM